MCLGWCPRLQMCRGGALCLLPFFGHAWCVCHIIIILLIVIIIINIVHLPWATVDLSWQVCIWFIRCRSWLIWNWWIPHMPGFLLKVPPKNHCSIYLRKTLRYFSMCSIFEHFLEEATFEGVGHKLIFCDFSVSVRVNCFPVRIWACYKARGSKTGAKDINFSITRQNSGVKNQWQSLKF